MEQLAQRGEKKVHLARSSSNVKKREKKNKVSFSQNITMMPLLRDLRCSFARAGRANEDRTDSRGVARP